MIPKISGDFKINSMLFAVFFNEKIRGAFPKLFPYPLDAENFRIVMSLLLALTGKKTINLHEFCGHFSIMYNETGGTFKPLREMGGAAYCFNTVMPYGNVKHSYNKAPNQLAGDQLKAWGVISSDADVALWNGQVYPASAPQNVQTASQKCDYYRFRGWGFNQITWRNAYETCLQPNLPKKMDEYGYDEFEALLNNNFELAAKTFYNYCNASAGAQSAVQALEQGNYVPYGNLVTGGWAWYVQNSFVPRCQSVYRVLATAKIGVIEKYAIEGLSLSPQQIKAMQMYMLDRATPELKAKMINSGGADGFWGDITECAFESLNISVQDLLEITKFY